MAHVSNDDNNIDDNNNNNNNSDKESIVTSAHGRFHFTGNINGSNNSVATGSGVSEHPLPSRASKTFRQRARNHRNLKLIMDHLNHQNHDAQEILISLGFQPEIMETRIPERFLHESNLKGIDFDYRYVVGKRSLFSFCKTVLSKFLNDFDRHDIVEIFIKFFQRFYPFIRQYKWKQQNPWKCRDCNPVIESQGDFSTTKSQRSDDIKHSYQWTHLQFSDFCLTDLLLKRVTHIQHDMNIERVNVL
jgi:hypothetical protein